MTPPAQGDGTNPWDAWRIFVVKELERLDRDQRHRDDRLHRRLDEMQAFMGELKTGMAINRTDLSTIKDAAKTEGGKNGRIWGGIIAFAAAVLTYAIDYLKQ